MTFSGSVKEELSGRVPRKTHCCRAECAAMLLCGFRQRQTDGGTVLHLQMPQEAARRKCFTLLRKTGTMDSGEDVRDLRLSEVTAAGFGFLTDTHGTLSLSPDAELLSRTCCRRAFIRGAFLSCGSVNDPQKTAHLEFVCHSAQTAELLKAILQKETVKVHRTERSGRFVVYVKDGTDLSTVLAMMEAPKAVMAFENGRILKEIRSGVNRKVNCEAANISKTVSAAVRQIEEIRFIEAHGGLSQLPESLQEIARLRVTQEDLTLEDLGKQLDPPLGKSGVNHRMRRISAIAGNLGFTGGNSK